MIFNKRSAKKIDQYKNVIALILLSLVFATPGCKTGQESAKQDNKDGWVTGEGIGTIADNEIGKAKDDALNDAKRDAVKKVIGTMIQSRTEIDSGVFQSSELTAKSEGFIETYEIIQSGALSKYEYQVKIRAKVSEAKLEQAIEEMISRQGRPTMLVIVDEKLFGNNNTAAQNIAGTSIEAEFVSKGFPLVDRATFERVRAKQGAKLKEALSGNNQAAKEIGGLVGAEIVLVGDSNIESTGPVMEGSKMISVQSDISIRVIETTTGAILTSGQEHAAYPHINTQTGAVEASKKAAAILSKKLIQEITKRWKAGKVNVIELAIKNANYEQVKKIRSELLEKIRGVKAVHRKEAAGDVFLLQVEFEGDSFNFADRIVDAKLSVPLAVGDVKRNYVELSVK